MTTQLSVVCRTEHIVKVKQIFFCKKSGKNEWSQILSIEKKILVIFEGTNYIFSETWWLELVFRCKKIVHATHSFMSNSHLKWGGSIWNHRFDALHWLPYKFSFLVLNCFIWGKWMFCVFWIDRDLFLNISDNSLDFQNEVARGARKFALVDWRRRRWRAGNC